MQRQNGRGDNQHFRSGEEVQMWKSFFNVVLEAFAMFNPVAHMHYIDCEREAARQVAVAAPAESVHICVDKWVASSERMGLWQDNEDAYRALTFERAPSRQAFLRSIEGAIRYAKDAPA